MVFIQLNSKNAFKLAEAKHGNPDINAKELLAKLKTTAAENDFTVDVFGNVEEYEMVMFKKINGEDKSNIYISAGMHGDEPAPVLAILEMIRNNSFNNDYNWYIFPLVSPIALNFGNRLTPNKKDPNREYKDEPKLKEVIYHTEFLKKMPKCSVCFFLHEDYDEEGFYMYSLPKENNEKRILDVIKNIGKISDKKTLDYFKRKSRGLIDGEKAFKKDILKYTETAYLKKLWPNSTMYIFETPEKISITTRIEMIRAGIFAGLGK